MTTGGGHLRRAGLVVALVAAAWWWAHRRAAAPPPVREGAPASARAQSTGEGRGAASASTGGGAKVSGAQPFARLGFGDRDDQVGRRRGGEANLEGPMAIAAGPAGELLLLDQIHKRALRFRDGRRVGVLPLASETAQDLACAPGGRVATLDRVGTGELRVYDADGHVQRAEPLVGRGVAEAGAVTGVFADDQGVYVEVKHGLLVRLFRPDGQPDAERSSLAGRPTRDGRGLLEAAITDRRRGVVEVTERERQSGALRFRVPVALGAEVLHLLLLESDARGRVYLAADVGSVAATPPYGTSEERVVIVRLEANGARTGTLVAPPPSSEDEQMRPFTVDDQGDVFGMSASADDLVIARYRFP
jgi:hypothetical protein